ncbi:hypothetical protein ABI59_11980 [Acidobacteria bacterium Mor1]|nr:hypothetical protein ABI59_11980 [Acidobacteria bacterium Mor1]
MGVVSLTILALVAALPAHAEHEKGKGAIEAFASNFQVNTDLTGDLAFGLRGGHNFAERWAWELTGTVFNNTFDGLDYDFVLADVSFLYAINPESNGTWYFYFGPGFADVDITMPGGMPVDPMTPLNFVQDSTATIHAGIGVKADAGSTYIRPDFKLRQFDDCEDDCTSWELSLAVGFKF